MLLLAFQNVPFLFFLIKVWCVFCGLVLVLFCLWFPPPHTLFLWYLTRFPHPLTFLDLAEKPACSVRITSACVISWQVSLGFYSRSIRWFRLRSTKTGYASEGIQTVCGPSSKTAAKKSKGMLLSSSYASPWKLSCTVTYSTGFFGFFFKWWRMERSLSGVGDSHWSNLKSASGKIHM